MKKIVLATCLIAALLTLASCTATRRDMTAPSTSELPTGFELVRSAGNGYFLYSSPIGYFLVSKQVQGEGAGILKPNRFIDMVYVGKELAK